MMYEEFLNKVIKYGMQKDMSYNSCGVTYHEYKTVIEPRYMASSFTCVDDFCKATYLDYID